jgi:sugar lactone lactonase YvrE
MAAPNLELILDGFTFPEGPVFDRDGKLYICDVRAEAIVQVDPVQKTKRNWLLGWGAPNGATLSMDGSALLVAESKHRRILKIDFDQQVTVLTEQSLLSPNDLTTDEAGHIYFTDPTWEKGPLPFPQQVYRLSPTGERLSLGIFQQPNGIKYWQGKLFLAEGATGKIYQADAGHPVFRPFASIQSQALDGVEVDRWGRIYVAAFDLGCIVILNAQGQEQARLTLPESNPTNLEFSPDQNYLYVTEAKHGRLFRFSQLPSS